MIQQLNNDLLELEQTLAKIEKEYPQIARNAAQARLAYDFAWAEAIDELRHRPLAEGEKAPTVAQNDALATLMCREQMTRAREAEMELEIAKKVLGNVEARLTSIQTRAKLAQIEAGLAR